MEESPSKPISKVKLPDSKMNVDCGTKLETNKSMEQSRYPPNFLKIALFKTILRI